MVSLVKHDEMIALANDLQKHLLFLNKRKHHSPGPEFKGTGQHEPSIQSMPPGQASPFRQNVWTWYPAGQRFSAKGI